MRNSPSQSDMSGHLLTVPDVAKHLNVSTRTVQRYRETEDFPEAIVLPGGGIRFNRQEIQTWCDARRASVVQQRKRIPKVPVADARSLAFSQFDGPIAPTH